MKKGITFIVPVFNTSKTITKCIRSLVRFRDTYVVAVNDGSTDDSQDVLERLATKYDNLRVINSENEGASSARNKGLEFVETEYVGFCDSDDYYQQLDPLNDLDESVDLKVFSFEYRGDVKYPDVNLFKEKKLFSSEQYLQPFSHFKQILCSFKTKPGLHSVHLELYLTLFSHFKQLLISVERQLFSSFKQ